MISVLINIGIQQIYDVCMGIRRHQLLITREHCDQVVRTSTLPIFTAMPMCIPVFNHKILVHKI